VDVFVLSRDRLLKNGVEALSSSSPCPKLGRLVGNDFLRARKRASLGRSMQVPEYSFVSRTGLHGRFGALQRPAGLPDFSL
jgi:hypothetical protein